MCWAPCKSHGYISSFGPYTTSAVGIDKTPHFTDGQAEAQRDKVDARGVELGFALTSVLSPGSMSLPKAQPLAERQAERGRCQRKARMTRCQPYGHLSLATVHGLARKPLVPSGDTFVLSLHFRQWVHFSEASSFHP